MNTKNWRIKFLGEDEESLFFIEAELPDAEKTGHYPRIEVMMEDYGDHNGYTREIRMADAKLIVAAPEMLEALKEAKAALEIFRADKVIPEGEFVPYSVLAYRAVIEAIKKATELHEKE